MPNPYTLPTIPAELQAIIDADRERFAGWHMVIDPPEAGSEDGGAGGTDDATGKGATDKGDAGGQGADEALGEAGKKTLDKERAARKELEKQVAGMKAFQDGLAKLVSPDGDKQLKPEEALQQLADKVERLTHSNLVKDVARELGITEKEDLALLSEMKSEEQIRALAERLKPADDKGKEDKTRQRRYQPDPSAGKGGGSGAGTDPRDAGRAEARRRFGDPTKQTNQKD